MGKMSGKKPAFQAPVPLNAQHDCSSFSSGEPALDDWLKHRAMKSQALGSARTYVVTVNQVVAGYYSLAVGSVNHTTAIGRVRRNMPDPVPVILLARLAIDQPWQGQGFGRGLLKDAIYRALQAADIVGIRAMLIHAISNEAKRFYQYFGFQVSPIEPMTLMATLGELESAVFKI